MSGGVDDPLFHAIAETRAFLRLREIRFLGGIDYLIVRVPNGSQSRYTRYQHSIGVGRLALRYAREVGLSPGLRRLALSAALLHDVGHAPLSHSLEPVFLDRFGIEHHRATCDVIAGRSPLGPELYETLRAHDVDVEHLLAVISGEAGDEFDGFFSGPINLDTIEGILRSRRYASLLRSRRWITRGAPLDPRSVVSAAVRRSDRSDQDKVDAFWQQKDLVYKSIINSSWGVLADKLCQAFMGRHIDRFCADDYFGTETQVFGKLPGLRGILISRRFRHLAARELGPSVAYVARRFQVNPQASFFARDDRGRYLQTKETRTLLIRASDPVNHHE